MKVFCRDPLSNFPEVLLKAGGPWGILSLLAQETEALVLGGAEGKLSGDRIWEISGFLLIGEENVSKGTLKMRKIRTRIVRKNISFILGRNIYA